MSNLKKNKKDIKQREIDTSLEKTISVVKRNYLLISDIEVKAWKAYLIIAFVAGFAAALIWGVYFSIYQKSVAKLALEANDVSLIAWADSAIHKKGERFSISIYLNTDKRNIVAVQAVYSYNKSLLNLLSAETTESDFPFEVANSYNKDNKDDKDKGEGLIALAKPTPGVNGSRIKVAKLNFEALGDINEPTVKLKLDSFKAVSDSAAIVDDAKGTNILAKTLNDWLKGQETINYDTLKTTALSDNVVFIILDKNKLSYGGNYLIERRLKNQSNHSIIGEVNNSESYFIDNSVRPGKIYYYRVCQVNLNGEKECNPEVKVKTLSKKKILKTRLIATYQNGKIDLSWPVIYPNDFEVFLQKRRGILKKFATVAKISAGVNSYQDENVKEGEKYTYRLAVKAKGKKSQYSYYVSVRAR